MKISSGSLRGMGIIMPKNQITRPTLSRVRDAVFNMLRENLADSVFWDLFSGSGAVGLTALSSGAQETVFVEQDRAAIAALTKNIEEAKKRFQRIEDEPTPKIFFFPTDFPSAWRKIKQMKAPNIVWADPPYSETVKWGEFLQKELGGFVSAGTLLVMEIQSDTLVAAQKDQNLMDPQWELVKTRKYGACSIVIWSKL